MLLERSRPSGCRPTSTFENSGAAGLSLSRSLRGGRRSLLSSMDELSMILSEPLITDFL